MSFWWNETTAFPRLLAPRLSAALAASAALHVAAVAALAPAEGAPWGDAPIFHPRPPLRAVLLAAAATDSGPAAAPKAARHRDAVVPRGPRYFLRNELDVLPGIAVHIEPQYPEPAARRFLSGQVRLQLYIDEAGAVERVEVLRAEPPGYFEGAAALAFREARFTPGIKGGRPVKVQMVVEVSFASPEPPQAPLTR